MEAKPISKEDILNKHFVINDVLTEEKDKLNRKLLLDEAPALGNDFKQKVKIVFHTTDGVFMVETTVWAVTDGHVELKAGKDIPITSISSVIV